MERASHEAVRSFRPRNEIEMRHKFQELKACNWSAEQHMFVNSALESYKGKLTHLFSPPFLFPLSSFLQQPNRRSFWLTL